MDDSAYTVIVVVIFASFPFWKHIKNYLAKKQLPPFDFKKLFLGSLCGLLASLCFYFGLSNNDWLRHWHGLSHLLFGGCLYFLWGVLSLSKNTEKNSLPGFI
jgi:hypothetical protein